MRRRPSMAWRRKARAHACATLAALLVAGTWADEPLPSSVPRRGAAMQEKYRACVPCHGSDGRSTAVGSYPKIGGQNAEYLANALKAYRDRRRQGGYAAIMSEVARALSDDDIEALATYVQALDASGSTTTAPP